MFIRFQRSYDSIVDGLINSLEIYDYPIAMHSIYESRNFYLTSASVLQKGCNADNECLSSELLQPMINKNSIHCNHASDVISEVLRNSWYLVGIIWFIFLFQYFMLQQSSSFFTFFSKNCTIFQFYKYTA